VASVASVASVAAPSVWEVEIEEAVRRVATIVETLPETLEQDAWVGVRWRIRTSTFAHVFPAAGDKPAGSARAAGTREPSVLLTFRARAQDAAALRELGPPWFKPDWSPTAAGVRITDATDWTELTEVLTESYCLRAPRKLARVVLARIDESGRAPGLSDTHPS